MSKWVMHFYDAAAGNNDLVAMLTQKAKLNNGKELTYAAGIVADTYKGWRQFSHSGGDAGYRTHVAVFPDLKMGFIVFSNVGDFYPGGKVYAMADLFVKDTTQKKGVEKKEQRDTAAAILKDPTVFKKYLGYYISEDGQSINFDVVKNKLYYYSNRGSDFLIKETKDTFATRDLKFVFEIKGRDTIVNITSPDETVQLKKYIKDNPKTDEALKAYTGTYYCPELDCKYGIILRDHRLLLTNTKYDDAMLTLVSSDHLTNPNWWMNHLMMLRDNKNNITGFDVNSGRIMHLRFNKTE